MISENYLNSIMHQLATIIYNTSQNDSDYNSKDAILDSLKRMINNYNTVIPVDMKIQVKDFRMK